MSLLKIRRGVLVALAALSWVKISVQKQTEDLRSQAVAVAGANKRKEVE